MGLFARKKNKTKANANANANAPPEDDADREWQHVEQAEHRQQQQLDKDRKRRMKRVLKQMRGAAKHVHKLRKQQERRVRHQVRLQRRHERIRMQERRRQRRAAMRRQRREQRQQAGMPDPVPDATSSVSLFPPPPMKQPRCAACNVRFQAFSTWRHHCRNCGRSFCRKCLSAKKRPIPWFQLTKPQHICVVCDLTVFAGRSTHTLSPPVTASAPRNPVSAASGSTRPLRPLPKPSSSSNPASSRSEESAIATPRQAPTSACNPPPATTSHPRAKRIKSKRRYSRWLLPLRPFLRRKASADRLRHQLGDTQLLVEKRRQGNASPSTEHAMTMPTLPPSA